MEYELDNLRVFQEDNLDVLLGAIPDEPFYCSDFFPDPWPKKRHEKRRLVDSEF